MQMSSIEGNPETLMGTTGAGVVFDAKASTTVNMETIFDMLSSLFDRLEAMDARLTGRLDVMDARLTGRLDAMDALLETMDARITMVDSRYNSVL
jgi:hypothetical protein